MQKNVFVIISTLPFFQGMKGMPGMFGEKGVPGIAGPRVSQTRLLYYGNSKKQCIILFVYGVRVFNATFNNISVILWLSILLVEETSVPGESHLDLYLVMEYSN
jgi:hypothetical protein